MAGFVEVHSLYMELVVEEAAKFNSQISHFYSGLKF